MNPPWLSILMPTYNGEKYIESALRSIAIQADPDIECIVVDDGSTDGTLSILGRYMKLIPLRVERPKRTGNWVTNTNLALSLARGEYASFLHQDDLLLRGRLAILKSLASQYQQAVLLLGSVRFIDKDRRSLGTWRCPLPALPTVITPDMLLERLLVQNFICIAAPIFKREIAVQVGGMDENAWYTADWDFWLKLAARGSSIYNRTPLAGFRIHSTSQTVLRSGLAEDFREQHASVARRHLALWDVPQSTRERVRRLSDFSIEVNTALAGTMHGSKADLWGLLETFLSLGLIQQYRYLRDSRIWERASSRVKANMLNMQQWQKVEHD